MPALKAVVVLAYLSNAFKGFATKKMKNWSTRKNHADV